MPLLGALLLLQVSAASAGIYTTSSLRFNSDGKRIPLREHFERMREQQARAQAMSQVCGQALSLLSHFREIAAQSACSCRTSKLQTVALLGLGQLSSPANLKLCLFETKPCCAGRCAVSRVSMLPQVERIAGTTLAPGQ